MLKIKSIQEYTKSPHKDKLTSGARSASDMLKLIDVNNLTRLYIKITFSEINDNVYNALRALLKFQYSLPVKVLRPVYGACTYVAQKSQLNSGEKDIRNASVTIEPLNPNIFDVISRTPINQHIPIGTIVTIEAKIPFETLPDGTEPDRKFIWSNNLRTDKDIETKIRNNAGDSCLTTDPWIKCCHYCAIEIGSELNGKFEVIDCDISIHRAFSLFGFSRMDEVKEFTIWTYKIYNLTPLNILERISDLTDDSDLLDLISQVKSQVKTTKHHK